MFFISSCLLVGFNNLLCDVRNILLGSLSDC